MKRRHQREVQREAESGPTCSIQMPSQRMWKPTPGMTPLTSSTHTLGAMSGRGTVERSRRGINRGAHSCVTPGKTTHGGAPVAQRGPPRLLPPASPRHPHP